MVIDGSSQDSLLIFQEVCDLLLSGNMVIDGKLVSQHNFARADLEGDRVRLPPRFAKQARLGGAARVDCFLLALKAGWYRLVTEETTELSAILRKIEETVAPGDLLDGTDSDERSAIPARLIPCSASPHLSGWRIHIPKEAKGLAADGADAKFVFLVMSAGYVDLWFPGALREAVSVPISEVLP
jgi:hypothetical protein